ncbi:hypothetical protein DFQ05_2506 [Winogradskyella wandonensis]|uniref:Uncharacterized protein n=1 Tax=Winogradskyella wandonensis TaxID=1442586 RepID=A0A4R1KLQ7_9FLAO|nr:hypothetical protein [Winogradskyella wandonensis]TCK64769.1 hypothetical protein DFQ05_2506 [Winogradskyella wandonensis]
MKSRIVLILFLIIPLFGIGQNFELKKPIVAELNAELKKTNYSQDVTFLYLNRNYKAESEKLDVKKYDYPDYSICAFTQKFEHGIVYSEEQCKEAGGITTKLTLPKTDKKSIIQWVELIFKSSPMDIEHGWNSEKTKFGPTDDGAGCYFEIKETENNTEIEMYCGC